MLQLKKILQSMKTTQAKLAIVCGVSQATIAQIVNHGVWPTEADALHQKIVLYMKSKGVPELTIATAFEMVELSRANMTAPVSHSQSDNLKEEENMLLRKQTLNQDARKHFSFFRDPFTDDMQKHEDLFITPDVRYVRESMFMTAKHGGFMAVIGESGAGKSTLRRDLIDRIHRESQSIMVIEPYVLALEDNDIKGKTLKASHIAEAILATLSPLENPKRSPEARFRQLHRALRDSRRAGNAHVLIIEEAHALPIPTIKHLKRFFELEDGFKKLLSIILIGQPELGMKLSEQNQEVREVVQRCEIVTLPPLLDTRLQEYLKFKLERVGGNLYNVIDDSGIEAIRERLTISGRRNGTGEMSLAYPLAVGNLFTACLNLAASYKAPIVNADVVKGV